MSKIFFTSDTHFFHKNILKYSKRPFKNIRHMNKILIKNWNKKVKKHDTVYHLGDFGFCGKMVFNMLFKKLNGNIILFKGNHDSCKALKYGIIETHGLTVYMSHIYPRTISILPKKTGLVLCGHIHEKWKYSVLKSKHNDIKIPMINVGVDVWEFTPITIEDVIEYYNNIKKEI